MAASGPQTHWFLQIRLALVRTKYDLSTFDTQQYHARKFVQKEPPEVFSKEGCSEKIHNIHRKTTVWSLFVIKLQVFSP